MGRPRLQADFCELGTSGSQLDGYCRYATLPSRGDTAKAIPQLLGDTTFEQRYAKGFRLLPRRWVVERTFAWFGKQRRLSKDYEFLSSTEDSWAYLTMARLMLRRLAHPKS